MDQPQANFIALPVYEPRACKKVKDKCCKKYKKKGKHCKKCPKLLLTDPSVNFSSKKVEVNA